MFKVKRAKALFIAFVMLFAIAMPVAAHDVNIEQCIIEIMPFGGWPPEPPFED